MTQLVSGSSSFLVLGVSSWCHCQWLSPLCIQQGHFYFAERTRSPFSSFPQLLPSQVLFPNLTTSWKQAKYHLKAFHLRQCQLGRGVWRCDSTVTWLRGVDISSREME